MRKKKEPELDPDNIPEVDPNVDNIPELDDVVDESEAPGATPPPNLDLFGDAALDPSELRDALLGRISDELDAVIGEVREELNALVETRLEAHLRERIESLIDEVLAERSNRHKH